MPQQTRCSYGNLLQCAVYYLHEVWHSAQAGPLRLQWPPPACCIFTFMRFDTVHSRPVPATVTSSTMLYIYLHEVWHRTQSARCGYGNLLQRAVYLPSWGLTQCTADPCRLRWPPPLCCICNFMRFDTELSRPVAATVTSSSVLYIYLHEVWHSAQ